MNTAPLVLVRMWHGPDVDVDDMQSDDEEESGGFKGRKPKAQAAAVDTEGNDERTCAWALKRLQELRGVPQLRLSLDPAPIPRAGWLLMMRLPLSVRFPTVEAGLLIERLVAERNGVALGIWRPSDEEIVARVCGLPGAVPLGATEEILRAAGLWRPKPLLRAEELMTTQDRRNMGPRSLAA
ncbi:MAG TPA: hypothetical protein VK970_11075 [Candidatus Methylacidiphilales bacterium]|nr:hypothetical protein [Candidatus Methylacidiphilales bacterium]